MLNTVSLLIFLTMSELIALYYLKKYNVDKNIYYFIIGAIMYIIIAYLISLLFSYESIGVANYSWNILTTISAFIIGYMFFNEKINIMQSIGIIFGAIGIFLVTR